MVTDGTESGLAFGKEHLRHEVAQILIFQRDLKTNYLKRKERKLNHKKHYTKRFRTLQPKTFFFFDVTFSSNFLPYFPWHCITFVQCSDFFSPFIRLERMQIWLQQEYQLL
jgi:hypothetical protein